MNFKKRSISIISKNYLASGSNSVREKNPSLKFAGTLKSRKVVLGNLHEESSLFCRCCFCIFLIELSVLHPINVKTNKAIRLNIVAILNMIPTKRILGLKQNCFKGHKFIILRPAHKKLDPKL